MRFDYYWLVAGLVLTFPAPAIAQGVQPTNLVGTWWGREDWQNENNGLTGFAWLTLWPDSVWCFRDELRGGANHGGARWRLAGDTLWLADFKDNADFYHRVIAPREQALLNGSTDTTGLVRLRAIPVPDSIGWADPSSLIVYRVALQGQQLSLVRLDSLSKHPELAPKAVYRRENAPGAGHGWTRGTC